MRKSRYISVLIVGTTAMPLVACGEPEQVSDVEIFPTVEACSTQYPAEQCRQAFSQSQSVHLQTAPRFDNLAACQEQFGNMCQQTAAAQPDGSITSVFIPALAGFMLARALSPGVGGGFDIDVDGSRRRYYSRPIYVDRGGFAYTGKTQVARLPDGQTGLARQTGATRVQTRTTPSGEIASSSRTSRGGFGRTSARFGGGGRS
jgi:uncharacterized protein YgiB involved in biofilm formation